ncbi:MAG: hypothetical protein OEM04_03815 [Flavobacteriaceae bacterium]|nr:hypothetical protein [Flavobacteriaceae bacterium]
MKNFFKLLTIAIFFIGFNHSSIAQEDYSALNVFVKFGDNSGVSANYEIPVANYFTVAPTAAFSFDFDYIALGARADYYFDGLLNLDGPMDLWAGVDTGFVIGNDEDKYDDFDINLHAGFEYKFSDTLGVILEFGGGTDIFGKLGLGIHF